MSKNDEVLKSNIVYDISENLELDAIQFMVNPFIKMLGYDPHDSESVSVDGGVLSLSINDGEGSLVFVMGDSDAFEGVKDKSVEDKSDELVIVVSYDTGVFSFHEVGKKDSFFCFDAVNDTFDDVFVLFSHDRFNLYDVSHFISNSITVDDCKESINKAFLNPSDSLVFAIVGDQSNSNASYLLSKAFKQLMSPSGGDSDNGAMGSSMVYKKHDESDLDTSCEDSFVSELTEMIGVCFGDDVSEKIKVRHGKAYSNIMFENNRKSIMRLHFRVKTPFIGLMVDGKETRADVDLSVSSAQINREDIVSIVVKEMEKFDCVLINEHWLPAISDRVNKNVDQLDDVHQIDITNDTDESILLPVDEDINEPKDLESHIDKSTDIADDDALKDDIVSSVESSEVVDSNDPSVNVEDDMSNDEVNDPFEDDRGDIPF